MTVKSIKHSKEKRGYKSHPIEIKKKGQKIAVRVISQFGEECTKVLEVSS